MSYLAWDKKTIADFSESNINSLYNEGFLFTRTGLGNLDQTRSVRIDLEKFELSSENRRILKKTENLILTPFSLPLPDYHWSIGKMGKDFYTTKFGRDTPALNRTEGSGLVFSANKIKELLTTKHNFNKLFSFILRSEATRDLSKNLFDTKQITNLQNVASTKDSSPPLAVRNELTLGYCICHETKEILHYCYPFYNLKSELKNLGMGMMTKAIVWAKENGKKYIYLGSAQRPTDTYKFQFTGMEWFDGKIWQTNLEELKNILR